MKSGGAATERLRPIFVWGQRMIVAVEIWFSARNCVSLLYEDGNRKRMDMKTTQEYNKQQACKQEVNDPIAGYGTIDALKVKLVKRIMGMEALEDVQSVLNFVERQKVSETFEQEWERGVTLEQFRDVCKGKLKEIYADM